MPRLGYPRKKQQEDFSSMVLTRFLKRELVLFASLWVISGDPFP
jgi:hypothetical protein